VEYNTFGSGSSVEMTYRFDGTDWVKHFKVTDQLGNIRSVLMDDGMGSYTLSGQYDYKPFGGIFNSYINADNHRQTFIGKEKDNESSLGDFGVRKYDDFTGRFFQIDPLWEKYYSHTPYHYSANNPVSFLDIRPINPQAVVPIVVLDEIHHAVSNVRGDNKQEKDHKKLFFGLYLNKFNLDLPKTVKDLIHEKVKNP
jgi:RHS repeat-associated protein